MTEHSVGAFRASILHFLREPDSDNGDGAVEYFEDGLLLVEGGRVARVGPADQLQRELPTTVSIIDYRGKLIMPGFVDTHIHYPQTDIIASDAPQLLQWLETYTFPAERRFEDDDHASDVADFFLGELLRNGTTSALVFATVHPGSVDAIFAAARTRKLRLAAGKVLMDRNCPEYLRDSPESAYRDSKELIERWHGQDRLEYAITPRFAPTSTEAQLEQCARLAREHPDTFVHSHLAENTDEVDWVASLFPNSRSYLDVYDQFDLLRERAVYAHCIHLDAEDRNRMAATGAAMSFCPTSNLFLGSGLFDLGAAREAGARVGVGTDVGGGTSFSILRTLSECYKVTQLAGGRLSPHMAFYLATLGGAEALCLDNRIGNFAAGKEADFIVLDPDATPLMARRMRQTSSLSEQLFALMMLGDDRAVAATYIMGGLAHRRR